MKRNIESSVMDTVRRKMKTIDCKGITRSGLPCRNKLSSSNSRYEKGLCGQCLPPERIPKVLNPRAKKLKELKPILDSEFWTPSTQIWDEKGFTSLYRTLDHFLPYLANIEQDEDICPKIRTRDNAAWFMRDIIYRYMGKEEPEKFIDTILEYIGNSTDMGEASDEFKLALVSTSIHRFDKHRMHEEYRIAERENLLHTYEKYEELINKYKVGEEAAFAFLWASILNDNVWDNEMGEAILPNGETYSEWLQEKINIAFSNTSNDHGILKHIEVIPNMGNTYTAREELIKHMYKMGVCFPRNPAISPSKFGVAHLHRGSINEVCSLLKTMQKNLDIEQLSLMAVTPSLSNIVLEHPLATAKQKQIAELFSSEVNITDKLNPTIHADKRRCSYHLKRGRCPNLVSKTYLDGWCGECQGYANPSDLSIIGNVGTDIYHNLLLVARNQKMLNLEDSTRKEKTRTTTRHEISKPETFTGSVREFSSEVRELNNLYNHNEPHKLSGINKIIHQRDSFKLKINNECAWAATNNHAVIDFSISINGGETLSLNEEDQALINDGKTLSGYETINHEDARSALPSKIWTEEVREITSSNCNEFDEKEMLAMAGNPILKDRRQAENPLSNLIGNHIDKTGHIMESSLIDGSKPEYVNFASFKIEVNALKEIVSEAMSAKHSEVIIGLKIKDDGSLKLMSSPQINKRRGVVAYRKKDGHAWTLEGWGNGPIEDFKLMGGIGKTERDHFSTHETRVLRDVGKNTEASFGTTPEDIIDSNILDKEKLLIGCKAAIKNKSKIMDVLIYNDTCYIDCTPDKEDGAIGVMFKSKTGADMVTEGDFANGPTPASRAIIKIAEEEEEHSLRNYRFIELAYKDSSPNLDS